MAWLFLMAATVVAVVVMAVVDVGLLVYVYTYVCIYIYITFMPIALAVRSKVSVCGRSLFAIIDSNPAGGMDFCHL